MHVTAPPVKIKLRRVRHLYTVRDKAFVTGTHLLPDVLPLERYQMLHETYDHLPQDGDKPAKAMEDISYIREQRLYSRLTLVAEIARYLNKPCLELEDGAGATAEGHGQHAGRRQPAQRGAVRLGDPGALQPPV